MKKFHFIPNTIGNTSLVIAFWSCHNWYIYSWIIKFYNGTFCKYGKVNSKVNFLAKRSMFDQVPNVLLQLDPSSLFKFTPRYLPGRSKNAEIWISKHEPMTETTIKIFLQNAFKKICTGKLSADYYQSICGGVYFLVKSHTFSILFSTPLDVTLR